MAAMISRSAAMGAAPKLTRSTARPALSLRTPKAPMQRTAAPSPASKVVTRVAGMEIAQVAGEAGFIAGTAFTMVAITLVGLAVGFVLLRVEALVEEGKL